MIDNSDIYYTIQSGCREETKVKGSRFIASVSPAKSKEAALDFLDGIKSEFFDATHNCFAFRFGSEGLEFRAADDGEPSGSAGKPILFAIKKFNISDIIIVVTRYFGGTKLGVGGLARAYSDVAELALSKCKKKPVHLTTPVTIHCTYEDVGTVKKLIEQYAVSVEESYTDSVHIIAKIHNSDVEEFSGLIVNKTAGRAGTIIKRG